MLRLRRPAEPAEFDDKAGPARRATARAIEAGASPSFEPPVWRDFKAVFQEAQLNKCAYCEMPLSGFGQDHFRPKGAICELSKDPESWGKEVNGRVEGRRPKPVSTRGYWWLAYSWDNLRLACERCNTQWKGSLFPVADIPRCLPPDPAVEETCLLLDPYGDENLKVHLRFDDLGHVEAVPGSHQGFETIRTLGLDRLTARQSREEKARKTFDLLADLDGDPPEPKLSETLADLIRLGDARYSHAGMVRIIVEQWLGVAWEDLVASRDGIE